ncbi:MAG TPA: pantothenate kinase [Cytophagales bacterium]|jgi:type III pantothenate kinase|nr:pantothenate kinase [Cytophagales bacterium]
MNIVIDCGNTKIKAATFFGDRLEKKYSFDNKERLQSFLGENSYINSIVSSVSIPSDEISSWIQAEKKFLLTPQVPLPIKVLYKTPNSLGVDRVASACGAIGFFPNADCLVIDSGTCVNYEFVDRHSNYWGGAISPGIAMRFEAMHTFTKRLPLVSAATEKLIGDTTESCMRSGVMNGILMEVEGFINSYRLKYPELRVILCGGDYTFFENNLKPPIFAAPDLVLSGLNRILLHNAAL